MNEELLEALQSIWREMKVLAGHIKKTNRRFDKMSVESHARFDSVTSTLNEIREQRGEHANRGRLDRLEERLDALERRLT